MRTPATELFYDRGASQMLAHAMVGGSIGDQLNEFRKSQLKQEHALCPSTVGVYRQFLERSTLHFLSKGADADQVDAVRRELRDALDERGKKEVKEDRTSRKKTEVPEFDDVCAVFDFLRNRTIRRGYRKADRDYREPEIKDWLDVVLVLYLLCVPRLGIRPIELLGARREDGELIVRTAKRDGNPERPIPLLGWSYKDIAALDLLLKLVPHSIDAEGYLLWRNRLASKLARASKTVCGERLSLYFGRHTAIARWRELGLSMEQIKILAGHAGLSSQQTYGRWAGRGIVHWISDSERSAVAQYISEAKAKAEARSFDFQINVLVAETNALFDRAKSERVTKDIDGQQLQQRYLEGLEKLIDDMEAAAGGIRAGVQNGRRPDGPGG